MSMLLFGFTITSHFSIIFFLSFLFLIELLSYTGSMIWFMNDGFIAQLVEHATDNRKVDSSNLSKLIFFSIY